MLSRQFLWRVILVDGGLEGEYGFGQVEFTVY